ncbi:MAG TPA: hypothetical protein VEG60_30540 [Candidatus Binatia bacterium]|nr:hypothetical protein [Candidatus Binatia bacterium]
MNNGWLLKLASVRNGLALFLILGLTDFGQAAGKGGGGKPPPPSPTPATYDLVFRSGSDIVLADANGGNKTAVYNLDIGLNSASWCSPDGTDVVFVGEINGQPGVYRLQVIQVDESNNRTVQVGNPRLIAKTNDIGLTRPTCSPVPIGLDQTIKVVFRDREVEPDGSLSPYDNFYLANVNEDFTEDINPVLLLDGQQRGGLAQFNPSWSPLGDRIVFSSVPWNSGSYDVEVVAFYWDANTGNLILDGIQSLVRGVIGSPLGLRDTFLRPSWSNNGERIVVDADSADPITNAHEIWLIPVANPAEAKQIIYAQNSDVIRAGVAWSPDDSQLIYLRNPRRGMCGEGDGRKVKGSVLALSNVVGVLEPIDKNGLLCDEIAVTEGRLPDWWRGAPQQ